MPKRLLVIPTVICALCASGSCAVGATVYAQLFPYTGEIRLRNKGLTPVPLVFYSIHSESGALNGSSSVWKSISDNYDASGNGLIDAANEWLKISTTPMELAEGVFIGPGGSLAGMRAISLGRVWNPDAVPFPDLVFEMREPNEQQISVFMEYAVDGDYLADGTIHQADYDIWRQYFGSTSILLADGNLDGIVDAADYVVWRKNVGLHFPAAGQGASPAALSAAAAVPEPATAVLLIAACSFFGVIRARRAD